MNLFRDDDINRFTDIQVFLAIHDLFIKHNKVYTCVLEMKDLWESRGLWHLLMTLPNIDLALHCWEHQDYSVLSYSQAVIEITKALDYFKTKANGGYERIKPITVLYPTWNRVSVDLKKACESCGLILDNRHEIDKGVYNFHWWDCINQKGLKELECRLKE